MSNSKRPRDAITGPDPDLQRSLRVVLALGVLLVLLLPMARGFSDWLGWMPMWLVGMPAVALWSLHRFRLPSRRDEGSARSSLRRRRPGTQARRRSIQVPKTQIPQRFPRAA